MLALSVSRCGAGLAKIRRRARCLLRWLLNALCRCRGAPAGGGLAVGGGVAGRATDPMARRSHL